MRLSNGDKQSGYWVALRFNELYSIIIKLYRSFYFSVYLPTYLAMYNVISVVLFYGDILQMAQSQVT